MIPNFRPFADWYYFALFLINLQIRLNDTELERLTKDDLVTQWKKQEAYITALENKTDLSDHNAGNSKCFLFFSLFFIFFFFELATFKNCHYIYVYINYNNWT